MLSLVENLSKKKYFTKFVLQPECCNFNQCERSEFITGHVIFNGAYNEIFQLKTNKESEYLESFIDWCYVALEAAKMEAKDGKFVKQIQATIQVLK